MIRESQQTWEIHLKFLRARRPPYTPIIGGDLTMEKFLNNNEVSLNASYRNV